MNVPKLRFKEFNDEWCYQSLSKYVNRITTKNKNNESDLVLTISAQYGLVDQTFFFNRSVSSSNLTGYYLLNNGDFAYNKSYSNGYPWGAIKRLNKYNQGVVSSLYICFKTNNLIDSNFLEQYFETNKWYQQISEVSVEGARNHGLLNIAVNDFFNTKHYIPSIKEQEKISKFLSLLDKKIELQSKKIEDLKLFKKGLLIKEFNNKKCNNKLKECFDFGKAGGTPKSTNKDYYNGYIPFLSISDMTTQGKYIYYTDKSITEAGLNNSTAWLVPKNSIIISMYASYGLVSINKIDLTTSQAMFNMVINKNYVVEYIYYYLYYLYISNFYNSIVSTGTQSNLNAEQIKLLDIYIPCYNEQKRIYEQFSKIDFKINLEQKKINELLYLKKGLMQNMFV